MKNPMRQSKINFLKLAASGRVSKDQLMPELGQTPLFIDQYQNNSDMAWEKETGVKFPKAKLEEYLNKQKGRRPILVSFYALPGNTRPYSYLSGPKG
jgi:hypothetical protein